MNTYRLDNDTIDSVELKCLVVSRGLKVGKDVYKKYGSDYRLNISPLTCNCFFLSDGTVVQLTDMGFHLQYLGGMLSWSNLKLLKYASELGTPFALELVDGKAALLYKSEFVDFVAFPPKTDFYRQKTSRGTKFIGNAVIQGVDWVAFQCLWPCEYAAAGKPCEFCFSGADFEARANKNKPQPAALEASDVAEIVKYGFDHAGCNSIQITGGSTFSGENEAKYIQSYLKEIDSKVGMRNIKGELLLYITPPSDYGLIDGYFALGADRIAYSIEVWDEERAKIITPGKMAFTTRESHLSALEYIANKYGGGSAFSNFIIGLEGYESLKEGATYLAERGIIPTASIWMPMGRPVMGSMSAPGIEYYRRVKELFAGLYQKYGLEPAQCCGLNVCMERDIWRYSTGA
ncbi:MAG: radical SAM protein [Bacillota bacterium]